MAITDHVKSARMICQARPGRPTLRVEIMVLAAA